MSDEADDVTMYAELVDHTDNLASSLQKTLEAYGGRYMDFLVTSEIERYRIRVVPRKVMYTHNPRTLRPDGTMEVTAVPVRTSCVQVISHDDMIAFTTTTAHYLAWVKGLVAFFAKKLDINMRVAPGGGNGWYEATGDYVTDPIEKYIKDVEDRRKRQEEELARAEERQAINSIFEAWRSAPRQGQ